MIYAYYRVSTEIQNYANQKVGITEFCNQKGWKIDKEYIDNGISGCVKAAKRKLGVLLKQMDSGDTIITAELSRLGRNTTDVINICQLFIEKGVNCYLVKQGMSIDNTPMGKMMVAILSAFAEMERDLISQRTKEALQKRKADGITLGRIKGSKNKQYKLSGKNPLIKELINQGVPKYKIAKKLKVSKTTLNKFLNNEQF